jgi:hypothetical protein
MLYVTTTSSLPSASEFPRDGDSPQEYDEFLPELGTELPFPEDVSEVAYAPVHNIGEDLRDAFRPYWQERVQEVVGNGSMVVRDKHNLTADEQAAYDQLDPQQRRQVLDESDRQAAFEGEVRWAHHMLTNILAIDEDQPNSQIVVLYDVDEVIGKVPQAGEGWLSGLPELAGVNLLDPAPEHQALVREVTMRESARHLILRPALGVVTNYLYEHLNYEEGRIQFGLLTSHNQEELEKYLFARFAELCPGAFSRSYLISTIDSPMAMQLKKTVEGRLAKARRAAIVAGTAKPDSLSITEFMDRYPALRAVFDASQPETQEALRHGTVDKQGIKLFIGAETIRRRSRRGRYGRTVVVGVDDWPIFKHVTNPNAHYRAIHLNSEQRFGLPGTTNHTNLDDIDALLAELGMEARE